jgi:very-short-patch-repair endonuclease
MRGPEEVRTARARRLRKVDNEAEAALWAELRGRRLNGYKFVRQFPIGPYFADFACREQQIVVEVDGSQHARPKVDEIRDNFMIGNGWSVVRFWNVDVLRYKESVIETILAVLEGRIADQVIAPDLRYFPAAKK